MILATATGDLTDRYGDLAIVIDWGSDELAPQALCTPHPNQLTPYHVQDLVLSSPKSLSYGSPSLVDLQVASTRFQQTQSLRRTPFNFSQWIDHLNVIPCQKKQRAYPKRQETSQRTSEVSLFSGITKPRPPLWQLSVFRQNISAFALHLVAFEVALSEEFAVALGCRRTIYGLFAEYYWLLLAVSSTRRDHVISQGILTMPQILKDPPAQVIGKRRIQQPVPPANIVLLGTAVDGLARDGKLRATANANLVGHLHARHQLLERLLIYFFRGQRPAGSSSTNAALPV
ncbi:hypothetical protein VTI28DRAFT_7947 [Corynascus sepedonium]